MKYRIHPKIPTSQFLHVTLTLPCTRGETIRLQLPAWRSGRYEIANYAQFIKNLTVTFDGIPIPSQKITKDLWTFSAEDAGEYLIHYAFFASQMDAGGSWSDPDLLYLNFSNFTFEVINREQEEIAIVLDIPRHYEVGTALKHSGGHTYSCNDFQHLVDSPLIAAPDLAHYHYQVDGVSFHLWIHGEIVFDVGQLLDRFKLFTARQLMAFDSFPAKDYHFLILLLPYAHYHGVEHRYSTVITLGPASTLLDEDKLEALVGICSHELYHFWNVCRIRPKELLPYDFSKETYTNAGLVMEGVTTFFGDMYLLRSRGITLERYLTKLERMINREFESFGWQNQAITTSSVDLWLDGYKVGIPEKKVSIYNRGALIALCLDLTLNGQGSSLEAVMNEMWIRFGKRNEGYALEDFEALIERFVEDTAEIDGFFSAFVYGVEDILPELTGRLASVGIRLESKPRENELESHYGIILTPENTIAKVNPFCPAYHQVMIGDLVTTLSTDESGLRCQIERRGKQLEVTLEKTSAVYYRTYYLAIEKQDCLSRKRWIS
nr:M61 family peptidase [Cytophagales bacterium]